MWDAVPMVVPAFFSTEYETLYRYSHTFAIQDRTYASASVTTVELSAGDVVSVRANLQEG